MNCLFASLCALLVGCVSANACELADTQADKQAPGEPFKDASDADLRTAYCRPEKLDQVCREILKRGGPEWVPFLEAERSRFRKIVLAVDSDEQCAPDSLSLAMIRALQKARPPIAVTVASTNSQGTGEFELRVVNRDTLPVYVATPARFRADSRHRGLFLSLVKDSEKVTERPRDMVGGIVPPLIDLKPGAELTIRGSVKAYFENVAPGRYNLVVRYHPSSGSVPPVEDDPRIFRSPTTPIQIAE